MPDGRIPVDVIDFIAQKFNSVSEFDNLCRELKVNNTFADDFSNRATGLVRHCENHLSDPAGQLYDALRKLRPKLHGEIDSLFHWQSNSTRTSGCMQILLTNMPYDTVGFIGRENELARMKEQLGAGKPLLLLNGIGGIGKTELSKKYFFDHKDKYVNIGWIDYMGSLRDSLVQQVVHDEYKKREHETVPEYSERLNRTLRELPGQTLLVIDNIENPDDPDLALIKNLDTFHIIASSRVKIKNFKHTIALDILTVEQCREIFRCHYNCDTEHECSEETDPLIDTITALAGHHTLTVELLARTADQAAYRLDEFYQVLVERGFNLNEIVKEHIETTWHDLTEEKTFFEHLLTVFDLSEITEDELKILTNIAVLPPTYIDRRRIKEWLKLESLDVVNALEKKGWLQRKSNAVRMHQVIGEVVRFKNEPCMDVCGELIKSLGWCLHCEPEDNPFHKIKFVSFAVSVLEYVRDGHKNVAQLANNLASIYWNLYDLTNAMDYNMQALAIRETIVDAEYPDLAQSYNNLATVYYDEGDYLNTLNYFKKALVIEQKVLDTDHPHLALSYNNLGMVYQSQGDLTNALDYHLKALVIWEKVLDANHTNLATSYNNLAVLYNNQCDLTNALDYHRKALMIKEKVLDADHPDLALSYNNISYVYEGQGDLNEALDYARRACGIYEKILPETHPSRVESRKHLDELLRLTGESE